MENDNLYCPAGIETLLWYHCRCEPIYKSGTNDKYTGILLDKGCIYKNDESGSEYRTTDKGKFMVDMICKTPFPEMRFCDPREE